MKTKPVFNPFLLQRHWLLIEDGDNTDGMILVRSSSKYVQHL